MIFAAICISCCSPAVAQDSVSTLTDGEFLRHILAHHPVVKQVSLLPEMARQEIRVAKGAFDPSIKSVYEAKTFQGKDYYQHFDNKLVVPVWLAEVKAGFERNTGDLLSPELSTPSEGLSAIGISVPLLQGLFTDERRATLRQAQLLEPMAEAEKVKEINKLLLNAAKDYWDWANAYYSYDLLSEAYDLANFRFGATKSRAINGDLPTFDTLDAFAQVQNLEIQRGQAFMELQNAMLRASAWLWDENGQPLALSEASVPSLRGSEATLMSGEVVSQLVDVAMENHPELVKNRLKLKELDVERRFAIEKMKPKLNVDYNFLQSGLMFPQEIEFQSAFIPASSKIGIHFSVPLFLREARAKYGLTRIKITQTELQQKQLQRDIANEIAAVANELNTLARQIINQQALVASYSALLRGEQMRFDNGESSLFIINSRQQLLVNAQVKLYEFRAKYAKSRVTLQWAAGQVEPLL